MSNDSQDFLRRAIEKAGINRERFTEKNVPKSLANLTIFPFFGDIKSEFVYSSILLNRYKDTNKDSYLIVCSWQGHHGLYPYADEYWSFKQEDNFYRTANGFSNKSSDNVEKILLRYFDKVIVPTDAQITKFYKNGITLKYLQAFGDILYSVPSIPSVSMSLGQQKFQEMTSVDKTIFFYPSAYIRSWRNRNQDLFLTTKEFWSQLADKLLKNGFKLIVWHREGRTHDLSMEFNNKCIFIDEKNLLAAMGVMRSTNFVLDVFNGLSRYAIIARTPFLACDERQRYFDLRDNELDELCARDIPKSYIFSFAPFLENASSSEIIIDSILNKAEKFASKINRDALPSTIEFSKKVSYDVVKKRDLKQLGTKFFRMPQEY